MSHESRTYDNVIGLKLQYTVLYFGII